MIERTARRERWIVLTGLALAAALGLTATLRTGNLLMPASSPEAGTIVYAVVLFIMWWTMMLAMMLPSAAPAVLTYAAMSRKFRQQGATVAPLAVFAAGYAVIWTGFSAAAAAVQLLTTKFIPLTGMMAVTSSVLGGGLLIAAGLYQISPLKYACLRKCQSPLMFFARQWRRGAMGALRMGFSHGLYCLGCCWVLMGLLFYGGVMEPVWIVGLAAYVAAEKLAPAGSRLSHLAGAILIVWGLWEIYHTLN